MMRKPTTPAQAYALALGIVLPIAGIGGLIVDASLGWDAGRAIVSPWHGGLALLVGVLGLATWRRADSARAFAFGVGGVCLLVAVWGALAGHHVAWLWMPGEVLWLMPHSLAVDVTYGVIAVVGLVCAALSRHVSMAPSVPRYA